MREAVPDPIQTSRWHGIRLPVWLYLKRSNRRFEDTIIRWGSRRPLRLCWTRFSDPHGPTTHLCCIGRLHFGYGSGEGLAAGVYDAPHRWARMHWFKSGMAVAISWVAL